MVFWTRYAADGPTYFAYMATLYASSASESTGYGIGYGATLGYSALADSAFSFYGHLILHCFSVRSQREHLYSGILTPNAPSHSLYKAHRFHMFFLKFY